MNCCDSFGKCQQSDDCPVRAFYALHGQDVEEFTPLCPPCNQNCNQGRSCPLVTQNSDGSDRDADKNRRLGFVICCVSAGAVIGFFVGLHLFFN